MNEVTHFTNNPETKGIAEAKVSQNDNAYDVEWANLVREYLKAAYAGEATQCEIKSFGKTYKVLKRDNVTAFYDEAGNTLFDVANERLQKEYEWLMGDDTDPEADETDGELTDAQTEPESAIGKTIASIERQAFEAVGQAAVQEGNTVEKQSVEEQKESVEVNDDAAEKVDAVPAEKENGAGAGETPGQEQEEKPEKPTTVYAGVSGAETKLKGELEKAKEKSFAEPIIGYLIDRCRESESLAADICQGHKTWEKCYNYIFEQARKKLSGKSGPVRNDAVYEWAEDYYHLDDKALEEKKAKEAAERKKKEAERKKQAAEKKPDAAAKRNSSKTALAENKEEVPKPKQEAPKPKPKKNELDGQMDMFSLMGM